MELLDTPWILLLIGFLIIVGIWYVYPPNHRGIFSLSELQKPILQTKPIVSELNTIIPVPPTIIPQSAYQSNRSIIPIQQFNLTNPIISTLNPLPEPNSPPEHQISNFKPEGLHISNFYKQQPLPSQPDKQKENSDNKYDPDYWNYSNDLVMNGETLKGIIPNELDIPIYATFPNTKPFPNPNENSFGIPHLPEYKDDLRMGMGIPAFQGSFVNQRSPM